MKWFKNGSLFESDTVSLRVFQVRKEMNSQKCSRENWKGFKNCLICAKHTFFTTESSRVQVARASRQHTWKKTFEKISKCFSRLKVPLTRESRTEPRKFCVPLATRPSTREQVANLSREKHETPIFEKNFKSFSRLKHLSANESPVSRKKSLWWTRDWGMRLVLPVTELPEQGNTIFENFDNFYKNKVLSKNN